MLLIACANLSTSSWRAGSHNARTSPWRVALGTSRGRLLRSRVFGVSGHDPIAIGGGALVLVAAALAAALIPARRAATLDPMRALRVE